MNRLAIERRAQILGLLTEGDSLRATARLAGVSINTVSKLLLDAGEACTEYQNRTLVNLSCERIQVDEIWSFAYKEENVSEGQGEFGAGDVWTWIAIEADTKLVPSWLVGDRSAAEVQAFVDDLASRIAGRVQLTSDGSTAYLTAVESAFGRDVDFNMMKKIYGADVSRGGRPRPSKYMGCQVTTTSGDPDPAHVSTSWVERQNLTMRMGMRRFTRLTNGISKKIESHAAAVALHFMHYNFARIHKSLKNPYPRTPAMAAGVTDHAWSLTEIARLAA